ncbi:MAG: DUF1365 domain-containing protein [Paracoccaceae bacterium]
MTIAVDHIAGHTYHGRKGSVSNGFRYSVDYVLFDAEKEVRGPKLFRRNERSVVGVHDVDHGGAPGLGRGAIWVREILQQFQIAGIDKIELLAQPKVFGHVFNPVSFWLCRKADALIAVIAEVTNTFGERHSYLVYHPDQRAIAPTDRMKAVKIFYVSPFQPIEGEYEFRFDINLDRIGVWIDYRQSDGGLIATLTGQRSVLSNRSILSMLLRRPFGSRRVLGLIHWQAFKLWLKGAQYKTRPTPPDQEVSR